MAKRNVNVVLRQDVSSLGLSGDVVKVRPGFARNFLLPRGMAVIASRANVKQIEHEKQLVGGDATKVYLAGFSEGAQLTAFMQIAKLDYALGGTFVWDGFPLPPLGDMPGADPAAAQKNASYYGQDMQWVIWEGSDDPIFPAKLTMDAYDGIFKALGAVRDRRFEHATACALCDQACSWRL